MEKSALIIIDLQEFIKNLVRHAVPYGWDKIIENNRALIAYFDAQNLPVYLVTVEPKILWQTAKQSFSKMILQDELDKNPRLKKLVKFGPDAFLQSTYGLEKELKELGITRVFISGVSASNGVIKTARTAAKLGFDSFVIEDCCADRKIETFEKVIHEKIPDFGSVTKTADILAGKMK